MHANHVSGMFEQSDSPGPGLHSWGPLVPALSQVEVRPQVSTSTGGTTERWSSTDLSLSAQDFYNNNLFNEMYHKNNAQQPFCSPTTPGPSPHYPQTPAVSSPGPHMHHGTDGKCFQKQTSTRQSRNHTSGYRLSEANSYFDMSDPSWQHLQASQHHLPSQTEPTEDLANLLKCAETLNCAGPTLHPPAGLTQKKACEKRGRMTRKGEDDYPDCAWVCYHSIGFYFESEKDNYRSLHICSIHHFILNLFYRFPFMFFDGF